MKEKEKPPVVVLLKRSLIDPSAENRPDRSGMDKKSIGELRETIIAHGIQQPLKVRANPNNAKRYEIVFGERRWTAAEGVLDELPCIIVTLTDNEARELRLIENIQREGIHPLEEAQSYALLLAEVETPEPPAKGDKPGVTAVVAKPRYTKETLAKKIGKSPAYVYGSVKLLTLPSFAQDAMFAGKLSASVALLLARIPDPKMLEKASFEVLDPYNQMGGDPKRLLDATELEPMSYRAAKKHIQGKYMVTLRGAPFNSEDKDLVPVNGGKEGPRQFGGSCKDCPFRTGNMKALFPDVESTDVCTNTACFKKKKDAAQRNETLKYKAKGQVLLSPGQAEQVINTYGSKPELNETARAKYIDLREKVPGKRGKTYEDVLEEHLPEGTMPVVAKAGKANLLLLPIDAAQAAAKAAGIKLDVPKVNGHGQDPASVAKADAERAAKKQQHGRVAMAAYHQLISTWQKTKAEVMLRHLLREQADASLVNHLGIKTDKAWNEYVDKRDVAGLVADLLTMHHIFTHRPPVNWQGDYTEDFTDLCKEFDVDLEKVEAGLPKEEPKPEAAAK